MRIACPACSAAYDVPDRLLAGPARTLRCSRCGADFALPKAEEAPPEPAAPVIDTPAPPEPEPAPEPEPTAPTRPMALASREAPAPETPSRALTAAWLVSLLVIGGALAGLYAYRETVVAMWPASGRLYAALGLVAPPP